jgi:hypothetical protein
MILGYPLMMLAAAPQVQVQRIPEPEENTALTMSVSAQIIKATIIEIRPANKAAKHSDRQYRVRNMEPMVEFY